MILLACIEERGGILFFHKRVSRDRAVIEDILSMQKAPARLFVTPYSATLFPTGRVIVSDHPDMDTGAGDLYFLEDGAVPPSGIEKIILYQWNRRYPFDRAFSLSPDALGLVKISEEVFSGVSHEAMTKITYEAQKK